MFSIVLDLSETENRRTEYLDIYIIIQHTVLQWRFMIFFYWGRSKSFISYIFYSILPSCSVRNKYKIIVYTMYICIGNWNSEEIYIEIFCNIIFCIYINIIMLLCFKIPINIEFFPLHFYLITNYLNLVLSFVCFDHNVLLMLYII